MRYLVTARHAILPAAAVLVLGVGVYLFVEVRAQPAPPVVPPRPERAAQVEPPPPPSAPAPAGNMQRAVAPHDAAARTPQPEVWQHTATSPAPAPAPAAEGELMTGARLEEAMADANRAYDRGDLDEAKQLAARVLMRHPTTVRMLRIMVSASCIDGDTPTALANYAKLPPPDQDQMKVRCARYGVAFPDKP
jgi:hypothetical protein